MEQAIIKDYFAYFIVGARYMVNEMIRDKYGNYVKTIKDYLITRLSDYPITR